jgi:hypothetical protein
MEWDPFAGADAYQVIVLDTGLLEILRVDAGSGLGATLEAPAIHTLPEREEGLLWRVIALRDGNQIARSALHSIEPS